MTTRLVAFALAALVPAAAAAQHFHHHAETAQGGKSVCDKPYDDPPLKDALQKVTWGVSTGDPIAMKHFSQGMTLLFGFNYEDAFRNFKKAAQLDSSFAMAPWGMALAAGPNINLAMDNSCAREARTATTEALRRADLREPKPFERALIDTLPLRYGMVLQPVEYAVAMRGVWEKNKSDPQIGALFVESLMNLRPWALFDSGQREAVGTDEVLKILRGFIDAGSTEIGVNHYFIHAVEAGPHPDEAMRSALRLQEAKTDSGHLLHMPSHTFFLAGEYDKAAAANTAAIDKDNEYFGGPCAGTYKNYILRGDCLQLYYGHYLAHNYFFRAVSEAYQGRYVAALADAERTRDHAMRFVVNEPGLQRYATALLMLQAALGDWPKVTDDESRPKDECYTNPDSTEPAPCHILLAFWHWARGMAYATKRETVQTARNELGLFHTERSNIQRLGPTGWGNNRADDVLAVAEQMLLARIEWVDGRREIAIERLKLAATREDDLVYDEPPQWVFPVRQALGGAYLIVGGTANYEAAVKVFCADIRRHHGSGRSLYGMARALHMLNNPWASTYEELYRKAWRNAPYQMSERDLWLLGMLPGGETGGPADAGAAEVGREAPAATAPAAAADPPPDPCPLVPSSK